MMTLASVGTSWAGLEVFGAGLEVFNVGKSTQAADDIMSSGISTVQLAAGHGCRNAFLSWAFLEICCIWAHPFAPVTQAHSLWNAAFASWRLTTQIPAVCCTPCPPSRLPCCSQLLPPCLWGSKSYVEVPNQRLKKAFSAGTCPLSNSLPDVGWEDQCKAGK